MGRSSKNSEKNTRKTTHNTKLKVSSTPLQILMAVIPFLTGIFYEWQSALLAAVLIVLFFIEAFKNKRIEIRYGWPLFFALSVVVFNMLTAFWAVDKGMVWLGVLKYLPLLLFVIYAAGKEDILKHIPLSGVVMTVVSALLSPIEALKGHITVSGRLGGFFEYPNTFAMFLLICLILVLFNEELKIKDWIFCAVYLAGIALSGSRTVLVLTFITAIVYVIRVKEKKIKLIALGCIVVFTALGAVYLVNKLSSLTNMSTFYGRLLYSYDALPVILKHPFGLGYYGYYYSQGSFQTGVYNVVHAHNDFIQLLLDIGWIPAIIAVVTVFRAFRKAAFKDKVLLSMIVLHLLFDFDMQFISLALILLAVVVDASEDRRKVINTDNLSLMYVLSPVLMAFSVYFGLASFFLFIHKYESAAKIYPSYTEAQKVLLLNAQSTEDMEKIADRMLKNNPNLALANDAKARCVFSRGDITGMIEYKDRAVSNNKYELSEYVDYIEMLSYSISLYSQAGDDQSMMYCMNRCIRIESELRAVEAGTSELGRKINDQPELVLPAEYSEYIFMLQNAKTG